MVRIALLDRRKVELTNASGHKASIILEELKEAYGKPDYVFQSINIGQNIQKEPWFTQYGPNGRIPVLIDHDNGDLGTH